MKRQARDQAKIFSNYTSNKGLAFRIYKEFLQVKNINNIIKKSPKDLNTPFAQEDIQGVINHEKMFNIIIHYED